MKSTPVSKKLLRRKTHQVKIKLDGFQDYETTLTRKVNGWVFGNIVLGGAVGALVDLATGAIYRLSESEAKARMNPNVVFEEQGADFFIGLTMKADPSWEKIGTLQKADPTSVSDIGN